MNARAMAWWLALACGAPAWAAQLPAASAGDKRIRLVQYEPENVVTIWGKVGTATMILFEPDELVLDMDSGDTEAWHLGVVEKKNGIFVKPKASVADTNINVVTTKRVYNFDMMLAPKKQPGFMRVQFRYPAPPPVAPAAVAKQRVDALLKAAPVATNRRYTVQGSGELAPVEAFDDGAMTYLRFPANSVVPAIYSVGADGSEHLENTATSASGTLALTGVRRRYALRIGQQVACLFNEGYDAQAAAAPTNTASPQVMRVIKGETP